MELKERNVSTLRVIEEPTPTSHNQKKTDIARRPELDVIIVALTWGILLYHVCRVYSPFEDYWLHYPELNNGTIREDAYTIISAGYIVQIFTLFIRAWATAMFFYLSGNGEYIIHCQARYIIIQINRKENRHNLF